MPEFWDVYDKNGNKLNKIIQRDKDKLGDNEYHLSAGAFITDGNDNFLIQQRSFSKRLFPGKWAITLGSAISGEDKTKCALREIKEELGINLKPEDLKFIMSFTIRNAFFNVFYAKIDKNVKIIRQIEEVEQTKWVSHQQLIEMYEKGDFIQPFTKEILAKIR